MRNLVDLEKPLKIVLINTLYSPNFVGGAERSVQMLAEMLVKLGHSVSVISLQETNSTLSFNTINGVKAYYLSNKNIYWPFNEDKVSKRKKIFWHTKDTYFSLYKNEIKSVLEKETPDIVHTNNLSGFSTSVLKAIKSLGYPIVHTARDYYLLCYKNTLYKNDSVCQELCKDCNVLSKWKLKNINTKVDYFVGISDYIIQRHLKAGLSSKIPSKRIYNAVKENVPLKLNPTRKLKTFGYIGTLSKAKGVEMMLETFCSNALKNNEWRLKIAGSGQKDYVFELKKKYNNNKIEFLGVVDSTEFYSELDALIVPSLWEEPFGRVVIEAVQMGLIVFVSDNGGLKELSELLDPVLKFSPSSVLSFLQNEIQHKGIEKGQLNIFDNTIITNKYLKVYNKVLLNS